MIETEVGEDLTSLLHTSANSWTHRDIGKATRRPYATGPDTEEFLPTGCVWVFCDETFSDAFVVRLFLNLHTGKARLETAPPDARQAEKLLSEIVENSNQASVYRGKILHLAYSGERRDEYGDIEKPEQLKVLFSPITPVESADIVLSAEHKALLKRNIIDLATRRSCAPIASRPNAGMGRPAPARPMPAAICAMRCRR